ncbi:MAG: molybdenum cofactor guanylyltransferase [Planctomycetaceae bacterium]
MAEHSLTGVGGIVLCGGRSSRMGRPKHLLPFGNRTMLQVVVDTLRSVVEPVVVVHAADQPICPLPPDVLTAQDEQDDFGPLAGIAAGLTALAAHCRAAYVTSCDVPLLKPEVVEFLIAAAAERDAAVVRDGKYVHVLAGVYAAALLPRVCRLLEERRLRPLFLLDECDARYVDVAELRSVDPELSSFRNVNTPEDYADVSRIAGVENEDGAR